MLDTRGSGTEYSRSELSKFNKICDLYTNDNRCIYAELLCDELGNKIYFREWLTSNSIGDSYNFCIINTLNELKEELKKDVDHGDLPIAKSNKIYAELNNSSIFSQ